MVHDDEASELRESDESDLRDSHYSLARLVYTVRERSNAVHMEADTKNRRGNAIHYVIDGKVDKGVMTGSWNHDDRKGDFKITKK